MATGGELLIGNEKDMTRASNRVLTKLPSDEPGEYIGPPVVCFEECSNAQKRLVLYYKLFRFLYGIGLRGVRITLPSCCVLRIQAEYPDDNEPASIEEHYFME